MKPEMSKLRSITQKRVARLNHPLNSGICFKTIQDLHKTGSFRKQFFFVFDWINNQTNQYCESHTSVDKFDSIILIFRINIKNVV